MRQAYKVCGILLPLFIATAPVMGSAAAVAAECGPLKLVTSVPLKFDPADRPLVPVTIQDGSRYLLLDTGGVVSTVTPKAVAEFRLKPRRSDIVLYDVNGNQLD